MTFSVTKNILYNYSLTLWNKENVDLNRHWEDMHIRIMFVFPSWILHRNFQITKGIPVADARNYLLFMFSFQMAIQSMNRSKINSYESCYFKNYFNVYHKSIMHFGRIPHFCWSSYLHRFAWFLLQSVRLWDTETGLCRRVIHTANPEPILALSYSQGFVACAQGTTVTVFHSMTNRLIAVYTEHKER